MPITMSSYHRSNPLSRLRRAVVSSLLLTAGTSLHSRALGVDFEFVRLVSTTDNAPDTGGNYGLFTDYDFDGTNVIFRSNSPVKLYVKTPSGISLGVSQNTLLPGWTGAGGIFSPSISGTDFGFLKKNDAEPPFEALYVSRNGVLTLLANNSTPIPEGTGTFQSFVFGSQPGGTLVSVNTALSNGTAVFSGTRGPSNGLYYAGPDNVIHRIVDQSTAVKPFSSATIKGDQVVFVGGANPNQTGIYRFSVSTQALTPVVAPGTPLPFNSFSNVYDAPVISGENVAFVAGPGTGTGDAAIYTATSSGLQLVARAGMTAPGGGGAFANTVGTGGVTISGTAVAFQGDTTGGITGIYTTLGGSLAKVIDSSTMFDGGTFVPVATPKISGNNILFGTTRGIYLALSELHWAGAGGGAWDTASNWAYGIAPRGTVPTFVDPANGATITGPAGNVSLKALTVGAAQNGVAQLQLQPTSQLSVNGPVTITSRGRLDVAGTLTAAGPITNSGVITGFGQIVGALVNTSNGEIRASTGTSLHFSSGPNANAGTIDLNGGEIEFSQGLANQSSTGLITARGATLRFGSGLTNAGSLALVSGTTDVFGDIQNTGSITITGGTGPGTQTAIFHDDVQQNGTLTVSVSGQTRSVAVFLGSFTGAGGITGGGDVFFEGDLRPGNSPAFVTMNASIAFGPQARIALELGGLILGAQYDHLTFGQSVSLDGTLNIALINGFAPQPGATFDIFDFTPAGPTGSFDAVQLPSLEPGLSWNTSQLFTTGTIAVVPEPASFSFGVTGSSLLFASRRRRRR
jgi:hypothetical protein